LQQQLQTAQHDVATTRAQVERHAARRAAATQVVSAAAGDEGASIERQGRVIARTLAALFSSLADAPPVASKRTAALPQLPLGDDPPAPRLLQWATEGLRHLLNEPALTVGWVDAAQGPYIVRGQATVASCDDLSRDDLALLVIALQLSLARCFVERIGQLPLVLTDESLGLPEARLARLAELLQEVSSKGLQILIVTVDPLVSERFRQLDVPSLVVTRHPSPAPHPAPERAAVRAAITRLINER
jgi:hypothetical protein